MRQLGEAIARKPQLHKTAELSKLIWQYGQLVVVKEQLLQGKEVTSPCPADLAREAAEALCRSLLDSAA